MLTWNSQDNWDRNSHEMTKNNFGVFEITLPAVNGGAAIPHNSKIKVSAILLLRWIAHELIGD